MQRFPNFNRLGIHYDNVIFRHLPENCIRAAVFTPLPGARPEFAGLLFQQEITGQFLRPGICLISPRLLPGQLLNDFFPVKSLEAKGHDLFERRIDVMQIIPQIAK